jgi:hypothetical protein
MYRVLGNRYRRNNQHETKAKNVQTEIQKYATRVQRTLFYKWEMYTHESSSYCKATCTQFFATSFSRKINDY